MPPPAAPSKNVLVPNGTRSLPLIENDEDLVPLLRQATNEELEPLVKYIIAKGGVTAQLQRTQKYRQHSASGNHRMYADDIVAEIQKFGACLWSADLLRQIRIVDTSRTSHQAEEGTNHASEARKC
jgi:hypothetical protein